METAYEVKNNLEEQLARYRQSLNTSGTISKSGVRCVAKKFILLLCTHFCRKQFTFKRLSLQSPPISNGREVIRYNISLICNCEFLHSNENKVTFPWQLPHLRFQLKK